MKILLLSFLTLISFSSLNSQNIPIDFEENGNGAGWNWTTFENDTDPPLEIVSNPDPSGINPSSTVAKFTALQTGQPFAGCESLHGAGIGSFTVDQESAIIRIMVWKSVVSDVGIKLVRVDNWSLGEIKIPNTVVGEWEQLEFDFSGHIGNTYDQIVIFPDFADRDMDNVIYFDNVYGDAAEPSSTIGLENTGLEIFPNPSSDYLKIQSGEYLESYRIYSLVGELVAEQEIGSNECSVDISNLEKGMHVIEINIGGQVVVEKFIKN